MSRNGRGAEAVADMKARLARLSSEGKSLTETIDILWQRNVEAVTGNGYVNDMIGDKVEV